MKVVEKQFRDEITNRCIEFLDILIHCLLYIEQIYSTDTFEKRLKYNQIVYECQDVEVQNYIIDFLQSIKVLLRKRFIDQIGFVITKDHEKNIIRRYIIELHPIIEHSSNTVHENGAYLLAELDTIFSQCLIELIHQKPMSQSIIGFNEHDDEINWKLQMRLCHFGNNKIDVEDKFYDQFQLVDNCQIALKQIKSAHSQRLRIQLMFEDKY